MNKADVIDTLDITSRPVGRQSGAARRSTAYFGVMNAIVAGHPEVTP
jgi:hypothetical protein